MPTAKHSAANNTPLEVACPQCGKKVPWSSENTYRPFCSKRCQLIDFGAWADESHRIAGESSMDEADIDMLLQQADRDAPLS
ncbi:DNA gyrase inhibitor YacG [Halomonas llamarensis]|uniref:DNA gyrase inhibitor YacG n=1 Tax=Halomonas llamarensis TaxID=2945104 RepID=A0ABT0SMM3_9GAMM|nr:DNA gyrase inhibitor YacG [Halomonas llamarensis]MCL7929051.1 DNA gyrase inhibitor YacG [Halomonas llamarensis]